ncbi:hypothetical protein ACQP04_23360 [Pseudonocardia halophobica]|uniref:hypothetical protein n=1 Tax=Pseudonocardia halophobica TaxID=29401 RepID=UPI003D90F3A8
MPAEDEELARFLAATLDDAGVRAAVTAERAVLATLEAGCSAPVAAHADVVEDLDDAGRVVERSLRAVVGIGEVGDGALLRASARRQGQRREARGGPRPRAPRRHHRLPLCVVGLGGWSDDQMRPRASMASATRA